MIKTYIKRPIPVKALQWNGINLSECKEFCGGALSASYPTLDDSVVILTIHTLEGDMNVSFRDYIIQGIDGEFYPCRESIFLKTYEVVD